MHRISKTALAAAIAIGFSGAALAQQGQDENRGFGQDRNQGGQSQQQAGQSQQPGQSQQRPGQAGPPGRAGQGPSAGYEAFQSSEHGREAEQQMGELDRNRDQRIDQQEAQSDPQLIAAWAEVDVTQDGSVDATEYYLYAAQTRIAELEQGRGQQGQQQSRASQQDAPDFSEADTNRDGSLSRSEYMAAVEDQQGPFGQQQQSEFGQSDEDDSELN